MIETLRKMPQVPTNTELPLVSQKADEARAMYPNHIIMGDHRTNEVWAFPHGEGEAFLVWGICEIGKRLEK